VRTRCGGDGSDARQQSDEPRSRRDRARNPRTVRSVRDRAIDADEIADRVYRLDGAKPTRAMRNAAIRAAHRLIRRLGEMEKKADKLRDEAWRRVDAVLPKIETPRNWRRPTMETTRLLEAATANHRERLALMKATPQWPKAELLFDELQRIGKKTRFFHKDGDRDSLYAEDETWRATLIGKGRKARLMFHLPDVPVEVFAVTIDRNGVHWFEAEVVRVTKHSAGSCGSGGPSGAA
jgi:hypothetical protein